MFREGIGRRGRIITTTGDGLPIFDVPEALVQAAKLQRQSFRRCHGTPFPQRGEGGEMYYEEARGLQGEICVLTGACRSLFGTFQALVQAAKLQRQPFRRRRHFPNPLRGSNQVRLATTAVGSTARCRGASELGVGYSGTLEVASSIVRLCG